MLFVIQSSRHESECSYGDIYYIIYIIFILCNGTHFFSYIHSTLRTESCKSELSQKIQQMTLHRPLM